MTWTDVLAQSAWRATAVLAVAFAASAVLRRAPAAWRHFLWTAVMAALLVLPLAVRTAPKWGVITPPVEVWQQPAIAVEAVGTAVEPVRRDWIAMPVLLWLCGFAAAGAWFLTGRARAWRLVSKARAAADAGRLMEELGARNIAVLESDAAPTAMTAGLLSPVIVLPAGWREWPAGRLRAVLLHEWMHVRRRDLLAQALAQVVCCLYWFHPLVWITARRMRTERERACDDAVLLSGVAAHDYAQHLVEMVRALGGRRLDALAMAEPSDLEARVRALLNPALNRRPLSGLAALAIAALSMAVLLPASVVNAYAEPRAWWVDRPEPPTVAATQEQPQAAPAAPGSLSGVVEDPSGAHVPNARVTVRNLDGSKPVTVAAGAAGTYQFPAIPSGRYAVEVLSPGFKTMRSQVTVAAGQPAVLNARLTVGEVSEAISVTAQRSTPAAPVAAGAAERIRVGGMVQSARLIAKVNPVYPDDLKAKGITGTVMIEAIITKQGYLSDVRVLNTDVDPGLAAAATDAVSHWLYQPTLLNGEPVQVLTNIDITFGLSQ